MNDRERFDEPADIDVEMLRQVGHEAIDAIADYHAQLDHRPVLPRVQASAIAEQFKGDLPERGESAASLVADWRDRVHPLLTSVGSPRHFAYVNGSGARIGILAEALAACTNTSGSAWNLGPAAVEIESQCLRWLSRFVHYPEDAGGILLSGGTLANFTALLTALRHAAPYDSTAEGVQSSSRTGRFLIYMSDHEGHVSVVRAADMLNLGRAAVRRVPSRADFTIDVDALDRMLRDDRLRGDLPFCVVAQVGSVNVGTIDPLDRLADVCARHRVWLHGDGACGLLAGGLPEFRDRFKGVERADSLSVDAHKLLGVPYGCGVLLVGHRERLRRAFSITAPYLRSAFDTNDERTDYVEYGPEMSRSFRALKVWIVLRSLGAAGLRRLVRRQIALAAYLHGLVRDHPDFEVLHDPLLYLYCFRYVPNRFAGGEPAASLPGMLDRLNQNIADAIQRSGVALLMTTRIHGRVALRMSICSQRTTRDDIDRTFDAIASTGRRLANACETATCNRE